jgi:cytoskeletal protein CcmA (bactofilin family)
MSQVFDALKKAEQVRKEAATEHGAVAPGSPKAAAAAGAPAYLGANLRIRGEIAGDEPLLIDGAINGLISIAGYQVTVGRTAEVTAQIVAAEVLVYGKVDGDLRASERVVIKKDASVSGEVATPRIVIEEGAYVNATIRKAIVR